MFLIFRIRSKVIGNAPKSIMVMIAVINSRQYPILRKTTCCLNEVITIHVVKIKRQTLLVYRKKRSKKANGAPSAVNSLIYDVIGLYSGLSILPRIKCVKNKITPAIPKLNINLRILIAITSCTLKFYLCFFVSPAA